ncbi:MAG: mevalonate kinase [Candidatus Aenigmarchaeota archaeon]|nr:mevalonate kinase [Candidatus Aenigmarchaeota archaeon]
MVHASAPAKIILFGEHVSRYGRPALIMAVDQRLHAYIEKRSGGKIILNCPDVGFEDEEYPSENLKFVSTSIKKFFEKTGKEGSFALSTKSEMMEGIGSSAAAVVATIGALDAHFGTKLSKREIVDLGFEIIFEVQGFGSGQDVATATYGGLIKFEKGKEPVQVTNKQLPIIIGNTGIKVRSGPIVEAVQALEKKYPFVFERTIEAIAEISLKAEEAIKKGDLEALGELMNLNHGLLYTAGVSSEILEKLIWAARNAGALGAKLSGAGVGDNMIALARPGEEHKIKTAIEKAGGRVINAGMASEGLVVER